MPHDLDRHRRSIRLKGYDYTHPDAYFVTICTYRQGSLFGEVVDEVMRLSPFGQVVDWYWQRIPRHFGHVRPDAWVVMPNHVHGILWIVDDGVGAMHPARQAAVSNLFAADDASRMTDGDLGGASPLPPARPAGGFKAT